MDPYPTPMGRINEGKSYWPRNVNVQGFMKGPFGSGVASLTGSSN